MKKGIIFDFDGLIIDTEAAWHKAYEKWLLDNHNHTLDFELFLTCIGTTNYHFVDALNETLGTSISHKEFNEGINALADKFGNALPLRPGVKDILEFAKHHDIPCAIGTSSPQAHLDIHLDRLGIREYFKGFVTADQVDEIKPNPAIYNQAAELLGFPKSEIVIFEDSLNGLKAGNNAGIDVVVVANDITKHINFPSTYLDKTHSFAEFDYESLFK